MSLAVLLTPLHGKTIQATTYGWGEMSCLRNRHPAPCTTGAVTSTGEKFDISLPTAAIHVPRGTFFKPTNAFFKLTEDSECQQIRINDTKGNRGIDLSPASLVLLGAKASRHWSGKVIFCGFVK